MRIKTAIYDYTTGKDRPHEAEGEPPTRTLIGFIIWDEDTNTISTNPGEGGVGSGMLQEMATEPYGLMMPRDDPKTFRIFRPEENPEDRREFVEHLWLNFKGPYVMADKSEIEEFL